MERNPQLADLGQSLGTLALLVRPPGSMSFPIAKVGKYIENGPEDTAARTRVSSSGS